MPDEQIDQHDDRNSAAVQLEKDIRGGEKWLIGIGVATLLINSGIALIYLSQLQQMRIATQASTRAAQLAADAMEFNDSHFDRQMWQAISQTAASIKAANAAGSAADTAKQTLRVSERAYLSIEDPTFDFGSKAMRLPLSNTGHIPSGALISTIHEATYDTSGPIIWEFAAEKSWQHTNWDSISPGNHNSVLVPIPLLDGGLIDSGKQFVIVAGTLSYNDGFKGSPKVIWRFCFRNVYQAIAKKSFLITCSPDEVIPNLEKQDGYPNNEHRE